MAANMAMDMRSREGSRMGVQDEIASQLLATAQSAWSTGRFEEADALLAQAARVAPKVARVHHDRGGLFYLLGRLAESEASLRLAHDLAPHDPKTRHALGIVLLAQGRYREGWSLYDARHDVSELGLIKPIFPFPEWRGEDLRGKRLLIFPEQGFGDQIQFSRFSPWLEALGAEVTLLCNPLLARLFEHSFQVQVIAASGAVEFPDPDYWVMSGSITGRTGLEPENLPNRPYLSAPPGGAKISERIGIATRGNPAHRNDANRSLPTALAERLGSLPGVIDLHQEATGAGDFLETAALVSQLDLVISVDTAVAHLAAAMGKPTWIMLPALGTDWRWQTRRTDSPWYPSARLFRQSSPGNWTPTIDAIVAELSDAKSL